MRNWLTNLLVWVSDIIPECSQLTSLSMERREITNWWTSWFTVENIEETHILQNIHKNFGCKSRKVFLIENRKWATVAVAKLTSEPAATLPSRLLLGWSIQKVETPLQQRNSDADEHPDNMYVVVGKVAMLLKCRTCLRQFNSKHYCR